MKPQASSKQHPLMGRLGHWSGSPFGSIWKSQVLVGKEGKKSFTHLGSVPEACKLSQQRQTNKKKTELIHMCSTHTQTGNSGMSNSKGWVELGAAVASYQRITHLERKDETKEERVRLLGMIHGAQYMWELMGEKGGLGKACYGFCGPSSGQRSSKLVSGAKESFCAT